MSENRSELQRNGFEQLYPELSMWLKHGGRLQIRPATETEVEVWLGDPGGYPSDANRRGSMNEVLHEAELMAAQWRIETRRFQLELASDSGFRHERYIRVTGWPLLANPNYDPTALPHTSKDAGTDEDV